MRGSGIEGVAEMGSFLPFPNPKHPFALSLSKGISSIKFRNLKKE